MNTHPLVSICIPTYNGEQYVADTLRSVLAQTYRPLEIVISDDQSTDRTLGIAAQILQSAEVAWRVYHHAPEGMVQNWNYCVAQARGEFIKLLFQDDLITPDCVAEMVTVAQQNEQIGLVFCKRGLLVEQTSANDALIKFLIRAGRDVHKGWTHLQPIQAGTALLADPRLLHGNLNKIGEPSCVLLRKEVFTQVGWFNPERCQVVDIEFWLRVMMQYQIGFVDRELTQFRIHAAQYSIQNLATERAGEDWKNFFYWLWTGPVKPYLHPHALRKLRRKCLRLGVLPNTPKPLIYQLLDAFKQRYPAWRWFL